MLGSHVKCDVIIEKQAEQPMGVCALAHIDPFKRNAACIIDRVETRFWEKKIGHRGLGTLIDVCFSRTGAASGIFARILL